MNNQLEGKTGSTNLTINDFLNMTDVAEAIKSQKTEVNKVLSREEIKADIRERLKATWTKQGKTFNEAETEVAINNYFSGLYEFKQPSRDFKYQLASLYVDRKRIGKVYGIPAAVIASLSLVTGLTVKGIDVARKNSAERNVEQSVEELYVDKQSLESKLSESKSSSLVKQLPKSESEGFSSDMKYSQKQLGSLDSFFKEFCSDGSSDDDITQSNYLKVRDNLDHIRSTLEDAKTALDHSTSILQTQNDINSARKSLDFIIKDIHNVQPAPPQRVINKAESIYERGVNSIEKRKLTQANQYLSELETISQDLKEFSAMPPQVEQLYSTIKEIAKEDRAVKTADKLHKEATLYVQNFDVPNLRKALDGLENLEDQLNQEYTLVIHQSDIEGDRSGVWRYWNQDPSKKSYYIIVEAKTPNGNLLKMRIKNEETGETENVTKWGERVPESVYERVKSDKLDNGIVDQTTFGRKERGYLDNEITFTDNNGKILPRTGQITEW